MAQQAPNTEVRLNELREREAKLAEAQAVAHVGSWEWDLVSDEATWSAELYRIFGVDPEEFEITWAAFLGAVYPDDRERVAASLIEAAERGEDYEMEYRIVRPDAEVRTVIARARVFTDLDGATVRMVGAALDVSDHKRAHERLEAREALLNVAQDLTKVGSFEWEVGADRVSWSDGLYRIFGVERGDGAATFEDYLERVHPEEREDRRRSIQTVLETGQPAEGEHRIIRPNGEVRWIESRIRALTNEGGEPIRLVGACQDITERRLATEGLEREMHDARARALSDPLTGLANRTLALDRLQHAFALAQRRESDLAVLFIDIDGFKRINDRYGHAVGDAVLIAVARRLERNVRHSDTVARIGGDEFLVVCEEAEGAPEAVETAERLHGSFAAAFDVEGFDGRLSISIGVSSIAGRSALEADMLVREADEAMYQTKRRGPGGYELHRAIGD
jgi:diguanylate cyclase (GGDEF)-like protein/PAS domain S-box-containing protein